jgi:hypothetical protein
MSEPAFLALWNDLAPGREADYEEWHAREHLPERVAAPGFRAGRRYRDAAHPTHRWFTLYEVDSLATFGTPEYRDLLDNPTPWSATMRPDFRRFLRAPCREAGREGQGIGAALAVLRLAAVPVIDLAALAASPGLVGARLGLVAAAAGPAHRIGNGDSGAEGGFAAVLLLEAQDRAAASRAYAQAALRWGGEGGAYDLLFAFPGTNTDERAAHRRPHWTTPG